MDRPTDLLPVVDELLAIQTEVREHFGWKLDPDSNSALSMLKTVEASEINDWTRPRRASTVAGLIRRMVLRPTEVAVLGAAVEAEEVLRVLERPVLLVAADGSAGVLSTLPDSTAERAWSRLACVVSDGDGASTPSPLVLTHQTPTTIPGMHNPGGFTDGDRAVCMVRSMGVPKEAITMLGTRTDVVGRWSGATDAETKMEKLQWMDKVLRALEIEY